MSQGVEADANRATREFARIHELSGRGWAAQARSDQTEADHLRARAKIVEAVANVAAARRQMKVLKIQRPRLEADITAAAAALRLAEIELENTIVQSPADGWIGERQARVGQYVRAGTLLVAVVPQVFWVIANFKETQILKETQIPALRIGDSLAISIDGIPRTKFQGRVESLSPASGAQFALLPPDNATGNFTRIVQ